MYISDTESSGVRCINVVKTREAKILGMALNPSTNSSMNFGATQKEMCVIVPMDVVRHKGKLYPFASCSCQQPSMHNLCLTTEVPCAWGANDRS